MRKLKAILSEMLTSSGTINMGASGFFVDEDGRLVEDYDEDEEEWPEEIKGGTESEEYKDTGGVDCIWRAAECGGE